MEPSNIPLSWESTGDKWWYASPIDCAAANGHYDLVKELLYLDENHLINLTSLRRIRRLEAVWDDNEQFHGVAKCRSKVAYQLYNECEPENEVGVNSLIVGGYGGWVLYTAASAGDLRFVEAVLGKYPFVVFGDGEYGLTDVLYGAARSKNCEVFRVVYECAVSSRFVSGNGGGIEGVSMDFKFEIKNRGVHAAARGGNLVGLKELLDDCCDVFGFKDVHGSTILHSAAGKGQVEVVKHLISSYDMISPVDHSGNTPLHIAAYKSQSSVIEALIQASPSSTSLVNKVGNTFLHTAIAGFRTPGFRRLNQQIHLMKQLVSNKWFDLEDIIDSTNNDGKTALHLAVIGNVHSDLVEVLITARYINFNISDDHGMTPLDYLKQHPKSASSEILIRKLISAGGVSGHNLAVGQAFASQGVLGSPGTSFRVSDPELFRSTGRDSNLGQGHASAGHSHSFSSISQFDSTNRDSYSREFKRSSTFHNAAKRLKTMFSFSFKKAKATERSKATPVPLRQIYSNSSSPISSPINRKKFALGVPHDILRDQLLAKVSPQPPSRLYSLPSPNSLDKRHEMARPSVANHGSMNSRFMSPTLCFGGSRLGKHSTNQPMGSVA